jgi:hypothetical protein
LETPPQAKFDDLLTVFHNGPTAFDLGIKKRLLQARMGVILNIDKRFSKFVTLRISAIKNGVSASGGRAFLTGGRQWPVADSRPSCQS